MIATHYLVLLKQLSHVYGRLNMHIGFQL